MHCAGNARQQILKLSFKAACFVVFMSLGDVGVFAFVLLCVFFRVVCMTRKAPRQRLVSNWNPSLSVALLNPNLTIKSSNLEVIS